MGNSLVKIDIHLIFHIKSTGVKLRESDLNDIFAYIGGKVRMASQLRLLVAQIMCIY